MASSKLLLGQCLLSSLLASTSFAAPTPGSPSLVSRASCQTGGQSYVVKSNDTCNALAIQFSTSTENVIAVNSLNTNCTNLIAGSTVCIPPPCNTYLVAAGDTCATVAEAHGLTTDQFFDHNPGIFSPNCTNLKIGQNVCLDQAHGSQFPIPVNSQSASSSAAVPSSTGTTSSSGCSKIYTAVAGDSCSKLAAQGGIDLPTLQKLNPAITDAAKTCPNIFAGDIYCIAGPASAGSGSLSSASCGKTYTVVTGDTPAKLAAQGGIDLPTLQKLNPSITDVTTASPNLIAGQIYCVGGPSTTGNAGSTNTSAGSNTSASCTKTYTAVAGDTCSKLAAQGGIDLPTLQKLNPSITDATNTCPNVIAGQSYCIAGPANVNTNTGSSSSPSNPSGMLASCNRPYIAVAGDTCSKIAAQGGIDTLALQKLNPGIIDPTNTCPNIVVGAKYCLAGPGPYGGSIGNFIH